MARVVRIKAVEISIGDRREVVTGIKTTTTATLAMGVVILALQEGGSRLHPELRALEPVYHHHLLLRQLITTVMVVLVITAEAISRATATVAVADTVLRLPPHMAVDSIKAEAEAEVATGEDTKAKGIGNHHHLAAMIIDTEEMVAAMGVTADTIGDMETTKGAETTVATVVEDRALSWNDSA